MFLTMGYLTHKQMQIWELKKKGILEAHIARELSITRQTVHKTIKVANSKISQALMEVAELNKIRINEVNPTKGILIGYSLDFKTPVIITFSAKNGVQIWYKHKGNCKKCDQLETCQRMLLMELKDRNIQPPENLESISPSELAEFLLQKIIQR